MKTKKNSVSINNIFFNLIFKNKSSLVFIFLLSIGISFLYNNYIKTNYYEYSISINSSQMYEAQKFIISEEDLGNKSFIMSMVKEYLSDIPTTVREKKILTTENGETQISFESFNKVDDSYLNNFLTFLNQKNKELQLKNLKHRAFKLEKSSDYQIKIDQSNISEYFKDLDIYPDLKKIEKIENLFRYYKNTMDEQKLTTIELNVIKEYILNFETLFNDDIIYSLNGWEINDNIFNNKEKIIIGIIFGFLLCSFFLFFKSNYFKRHLSNN